jgi:hypothetical protein
MRLFNFKLAHLEHLNLAIGVLFASLTAGLLSPISLAQGVQTPASVAAETQEMSEQFTQVLEEECPINICKPVGCEMTRFLTLDETQEASLPGMGTTEPTNKVTQYKLASVKCEFAYEPNFDETKLASLRQRVLQRVRKGGVNLSLVSKKLLPKADLAPNPEVAPESLKTEPLNRSELLLKEFAPFLPWLALLVLLGFFGILAYFVRSFSLKARAEDASLAVRSHVQETPKISAEQLLDRLSYVRRIYLEDTALSEIAVRSLLEQNDLDELCRILKHFGPDLFVSYKQRGQFETTLEALAAKYQDHKGSDSPEALWDFLERSERRITAAKVGTLPDPLSHEFSFMDRMGVDELLGLMDELTELEGLAMIVNSPQALRQELFASAGPAFVAKFVKYLTGQERLSDQFVRQAVGKARRIYSEKGAAMKIVTINKLPLLEEALNSLDHKQRALLLGEIKKEQPQALASVGSRMFLDVSLAVVPENLLTEAFLLISPKAAANYIDSLEGQVSIFKRLNPRLQEAIKPHRGMQTLDNGLIQDARQAISQYFKEKDREGVIDLGRINSSLLA